MARKKCQSKCWVNSRGLDAETLLNISWQVGSDIWTSSRHYRDHSIEEYQQFIYRVVEAFQIEHKDQDWNEADYWLTVDPFAAAVLEAIKEADSSAEEWWTWDASTILQRAKPHVSA